MNRNKLEKVYKLNIYQVVEGSDEWPLVETITAKTSDDCIAQAEMEYDTDQYSWSNPFETYE